MQLNDWIKGNAEFWIGLSDRKQEGTFVWESGRQLSAEIAAHWGPSQPNNVGGNEDCTVVTEAKTLYDYPCTRMYAFVCQKLEGESRTHEQKYVLS